MIHKFLENTSFHFRLWQIDHDIAQQVRLSRCPYCHGSLHKADYPRSPLGLKAEERAYYAKRFSLSCGRCRKRIRVPSVRFMGRKRYVASIFILAGLMKRTVTLKLLRAVRRHLGIRVSKRTWKRWRYWWQRCFKRTLFWQENKGLIPIGIHVNFPRRLCFIYPGCFSERILNILVLISPLTAGDDRAV